MTNEEQARYWNGDETAHWLVHEERYERLLAPFTDHLLTSAAIGRADRVVDIGCGTGSATRAAGRVAIEGEAPGGGPVRGDAAPGGPPRPGGGIDQCPF